MEPIRTIDMETLLRRASKMADQIGLQCADSRVTLAHQLAEKYVQHGTRVVGYYGSMVPMQQRYHGSKPQPLSA